ncbi:unnamed protein product [Miscanthus lutarioriparius]|uniref:Transposase-associated domain-containing protein n=1 Tax=Miscanthus lutarioriparius TaxID=422564 RepID=A0A811NR50_9POAL|nr:unnamed protein product [Miscanthus lutarioriparius]
MEDRSRWMYLRNCTCEEYLGGLNSFLTVAEADMLNGQKSSMWCPCVDCENEKQYSNYMTVHAHLIIRGFMDDYRYWNKHEEEGVNDRDQAQAAGGEEAPFDNQDLCDKDVAEIVANYDAVHLAENLDEM